jgi:flagellin-like protein
MKGMERKKLAGISPIISAVIVIAIVFAIAATISPWMYSLVTGVTNQTQTSTETEIRCRNAAYDFYTSYGTYGVSWGFSTVNNTLGAMIKNTGTVNLHGFSFELIFNETIIEYFDPTSGTQKTSSNPLKPGQQAFLNASFTKDVNDTLTSVKVLNSVCLSVYASQDV